MYVGLHRHSHYSKRDAIAKIPDMVKTIHGKGQTAWALTDHGTTSGLMEAYQETMKFNKKNDTNIKFIFGCEMYYVPSYDIKSRDATCHLIVLAKNEVGYKNLLRLVTIGYGDKGKSADNYYFTMRITLEDLIKYKEGLIFTSACMGGILKPLMTDYKLAEDRAKIFQENFEDFYLEICCATNQEQIEYNKQIVKLSEKLHIPIVVTEDSHYIDKKDASVHRLYLGLDKNSDYYSTDDYYIHSENEVFEKISYLPNAKEYIENTVKIADKIEEVKIPFGGKNFPKLDLKGETSLEVVTRLAREGWKNKMKYLPKEKYPIYGEQVKHELKVLEKCDYLEYFLMTKDFMDAGRKKSIRFGIGRGSVGGSLVAYLLDITRIDPIKYGLIFERFAHDKRVSLPDVDIDVPNSRRGEVIEYLTQKYKEVYHVRTFGTMGEKAAINRAAKALGKTPSEVRAISSECETIADLKDEQIKELASKFVGIIQHYGTHASAIMLFPKDAENWTAIEKQGDDYVCAYEYTDLEKMGLLKEDILGVKTLDAIDNAVKLIEERHNVKLDLDNLPDDDAKTFEMLCKGDVLGCFQIESKGMRGLLKDMQPRNIFDIVPLVALYRPSTIQSGMVDEFTKRRAGEPFEYLHPKLKEVLEDTYGVLLYQEQAMKIVQVMANYDLGEADMFRRAIGKKHPEEMAILIPKFIKDSGEDEEVMKKIAEWLENCASYQFNKSHSAAYGITCYQTAYLKAHYPLEYICSFLNAYKDDKQSDLMPYINDAKRLGIKLLPPIGTADTPNWFIEDNSLRMGLNFITGIGDICNIGEEKFKQLPKNKSENLIKAGAMDFLGERETLLKSVYSAGTLEKLNKQIERTKELREANEKIVKECEGNGRTNTKKYLGAKTEANNYAEKYWELIAKKNDIEDISFDKNKAELEVLGMSFDNPFEEYDLSQYITEPSDDPNEKTHRIVLGLVKSIKHHTQKNGKPMMFFSIECPSGKEYDLVMFNSNLANIEKGKVYPMSIQGNKFKRIL